jgi:UDP-N-acetylglucosamine 2-epimerase (non-hydrolysing)
MKKIMLIFGTRPEAIKMAPLVLELLKYPNNFKVYICVTGQHRDLLDQVLDLFEIKPDYDLNIMNKGQDLFDITTKVLNGLKEVLSKAFPDIILVHGDTTTSMAASIAGFYFKIPIGHVEAGLRTNDLYSPWPEEANRQITARIAKFHFAPTKLSKENLKREGVLAENIYITGNTGIDALFTVTNKIKTNDILKSKIEKAIFNVGYDCNRIATNKLVLITIHRRENFGESIIRIINAIKFLSLKYLDVDFVFPMHPNPNVRKPIHEIFSDPISHENVFFIEPLEYLNFVYLMDRSYLIITDSGGVQEEAPSFGKPVLVLRENTERPEATLAGTVELVGSNYNLIIDKVSKLIDDQNYYISIGKIANPYGDGLASKRITKVLLDEN